MEETNPYNTTTKVLPIESNLRNCVVASSCKLLSLDQTPATMEGRLSSCSTINDNQNLKKKRKEEKVQSYPKPYKTLVETSDTSPNHQGQTHNQNLQYQSWFLVG